MLRKLPESSSISPKLQALAAWGVVRLVRVRRYHVRSGPHDLIRQVPVRI
jgi:hypothetical protein